VSAGLGAARPVDSPRARVAPLLLGALVGALVAAHLESALACVGVAAIAGLHAGARAPGRTFWKMIGVGGGIAVLLNMFLTDGHPLPLPGFPGHPATIEGARLGLLLGLRVLGAALAVHGLAAAWPGERAADELARLLTPLEWVRIPIAEGRMIFGLAVRFVPLLRDEIARIDRLQTLRGGAPARGVRERMHRLQATLVPALTGALERAERVALALEARHYRQRPAVVPPMHPVWVLAGMALALAALLWRG